MLSFKEAGASETSTLIGNQVPTAALDTARRLLYLAHFFARFSEGAWQFALILFLAAFTHYKSFVLISSYGLATSISVCLYGTKIGRFVDGTNRLKAATLFIWCQNASVIIATVLCPMLLFMDTEGVDDGASQQLETKTSPSWVDRNFPVGTLTLSSFLMIVGVHFFGSVANVFDAGFLVAKERDWIVVMSAEADPSGEAKEPNQKWLSDTNVAMKQIDLSCRVVAPAFAGFVIAADGSTGGGVSGDLRRAVIFVGTLNALSLLVEFICVSKIYHMVPRLSKAPSRSAVAETAPKSEDSSSCRLCLMPKGFQVYLEQPISQAGVAVSLLNLNVLTFGAIMTAYLVSRGMRLETIGIWRGVAAGVGLLGTFVFHMSASRTSLVNTGMWSIIYQCCCITVSLGGLFCNEYWMSMTLFIGGVCFSRIGLYVFDISVTQLMQAFVPEGVRGEVGGTQQSLNSFFLLLSSGLGFVFPDPKDFHLYVSVGYSAVIAAIFIYALGIYSDKSRFLIKEESSSSLV